MPPRGSSENPFCVDRGRCIRAQKSYDEALPLPESENRKKSP